jgi:PAS domain S-box-containing protein
LLHATRSPDALDRIGERIFALDSEGRLSFLNSKTQLLLSQLLDSEGELAGTVLGERSRGAGSAGLLRVLRRARAERNTLVQAIRNPATGGFLEIRAYPSADGLSVLLLDSVAAPAVEVLDRLSDLFLACDAEWRLTLLNARAREYFRLRGESRDPLGQIVWDAIPGLEGSRFQAEAMRALAEQSEVEFEAMFVPLERWFSVRITPAHDGLIACARDVTRWRRTERALTREAERLAAVIETQQAVATAGPDLGAVMQVVAERLQALTGAGAVAVFVPEDGELILCAGSGAATPHLGMRVSLDRGYIGLCSRTGELLGCDDAWTDPRADRAIAGALQGRSGIFVPLTGEEGVNAVVVIWSGRPHAFAGVHVHTVRLVAGLLSAAMERAGAFAANQLLLGERTAALAAVRAGEERFRTLVESIDDVVFRLDTDQRCVDIFGRWLEREGFRPDQFLGRTTSEIVGADQAAHHERANLRALAGESVTYEWVLPTLRGPRHMQTTLSPLRGAAGEVSGIVGVGRDITQRIEAEQQIRQAQKMEAVGRFAGGVAHDLNNMMMIIQGFSDFLLSGLGRADPRWSDAEEIRKAAERAMHLTRQLLGLGRQRLVARQVLSLNEVVSGMERMVRPLLGEDLHLSTVLAAGLGGVEADYGQMEQVLMNLTLNARDAMRGGGHLTIVTANVDVSEDEASRQLGLPMPGGEYVKQMVGDSGHGMTPEVKAHLFEPFFTTKPPAHNSGLGLTTVYGIVAQSGGYLGVDSEPGRGATFSIYFPRVAGDDAGEPRGDTAPAPAGGSETILVVEDEDAVRALACRVLAQRGYTVLEAQNGVEALALVERAGGMIDLVLTDVVMPEMGGLDLVSHLARLVPGVGIMLMSGYTEADKLQPAALQSNFPFLQKPFSVDSLAGQVREVLDKRVLSGEC